MEGWQRAFVLHGRPYSETSLLLDLFTEGHGRVRLLAKGARSKRSSLKGALQPFTPLLVRWGGKGKSKPCEMPSLSLSDYRLPVFRFIAACMSMSWFLAFLNKKPTTLRYSSIISTAYKIWRRRLVLPNIRCVSLNSLC